MSEKEVFHTYPFAAFKSYSIGLLILLLGIRLVLLVGSEVTDFDGALILGFIISIFIISFVRIHRLDIYSISRIVLIILFLLSPFLIDIFIKPHVNIYLPWDAYKEFLGNLFSIENSFSYPVAIAVFSTGVLTLSYSLVSTWRMKFYVEAEHAVIEEVFPTKYVVRIPLKEILNVMVEQSSIQKLFDYGQVTIITNRGEVFDLGLIEKPLRFRELVFKGIQKIVEGKVKEEEK